MLETNVVESFKKHLTGNMVKFNRYKHKHQSWITNGIIKSLKNRDKLYKELKQTDINTNEHKYWSLNVNLKTFNNILKQSIITAKRIFYHEQFKKCKTKLKKT